MNVHSAGASGGGASTLLGVTVSLYAGNLDQQVVPIARAQRNVADNCVLNHASRRRFLGLQKHLLALHGHHFGSASGL